MLQWRNPLTVPFAAGFGLFGTGNVVTELIVHPCDVGHVLALPDIAWLVNVALEEGVEASYLSKELTLDVADANAMLARGH